MQQYQAPSTAFSLRSLCLCVGFLGGLGANASSETAFPKRRGSGRPPQAGWSDGEDSYPHCHWSAQAEIGMGLLIAALGACMIVFPDSKTHLGLFIGVFMASLIALAIPHFLIGGCGMLTMKCRRVAFPALTAESVVLLVFSAIMLTVITMRKTQAVHE